MKKLVLLVSLLLLLPVLAAAENPAKPAEGTESPKTTKKFIVHMKNGGSLQTDNYSYEKDSIRIVLPAGTILLDRAMVKSIEEVGPEEQAPPAEAAPAEKPKVKPAQAPKGRTVAPAPEARPQEPEVSTEETDDNGHTQAWWKAKVEGWRKKKDDAQAKYDKAQADWNKYNAALQNAGATVPAPLTDAQRQLLLKGDPHVIPLDSHTGLPKFVDDNGQPRIPTQAELSGLTGAQLLQLQNAGVSTQPTTAVGSSFDIASYQDMRGSARVAMDAAKSELDEATRMLDETLPDEARRAGAPPGWVR